MEYEVGRTRVLITTFGSYGDLHPYLAIGAELKWRRQHAVTIASSAAYRAKVEAEGLGFHAVRPDVQLENREMIAYVMDARRGGERIVRYLAELVRESYEDTVAAARHADLILTHPISFAAVLVAQKLSLPWISTVLAPMSFFSAHDPPVPPQIPSLIQVRRFGPGVTRWIKNLGRRQTMGWVEPIRRFRKELGLGPGNHPLFEGSHAPSRVLALFSPCLAAPQPDWPAQTVLTGFPFYDRGDGSPELERFLAGTPAPVVFTLGSSAVGAAGDFYLQSLEAVQRLGCRAVFLTGAHPQGLPERLPPGILALNYAPHHVVFPRAAAIVHQGGIGTTAQALRAGHPMVIVPFGHDQFDNGARVARLGAGKVLYRSRYRAGRLADLLAKLLHEPDHRQSATNIGIKVRSENGVTAAADAIEAAMHR
jgi:rhamnosyltransferase subunit B